MSAPALASGARALARIPVLFSTSFRQSTIFLTVTAMLSPSFFDLEYPFAVFLGKQERPERAVHFAKQLNPCKQRTPNCSVQNRVESFHDDIPRLQQPCKESHGVGAGVVLPRNSLCLTTSKTDAGSHKRRTIFQDRLSPHT